MRSSNNFPKKFSSFINIVKLTFSTFNRNRLGFQSVAISYYTTLSLIPCLALIFAFSDGWGISDKIFDILIKIFPFNSDIVSLVMTKANGLLEVANSGGVGTISAIAFLWVLLLMFFQMERIFNSVWGISKIPRKIYKRFGFYVLIMLLLPIVMLLYGTLFLSYTKVPQLLGFDISSLRFLTVLTGYLIIYLLSTFTLSAMYKYIPATFVRYDCALKAAAITSIVFIIFQFLYLKTQIFVGRMNSVYGILAAIPLFLIWLNISWQIIMYGASLTCGLQSIKYQEDVKL